MTKCDARRGRGLWPRSAAVVALLCAWVAGSSAQNAPPPWHLDAWEYRQVVEIADAGTRNPSNTGLVEFQATPPLAAPDGSDARMTDEKGREVKCQWVNEQGQPEADPFGERRRALLHFDVVDPAVRAYFVYFGNPNAPKVEQTWEKRIEALTLETRVHPQKIAPNNWRQMTSVLAGSTWKYGEGRRRQINDGENPYGPSEYFISIYRGILNCPVDGEYLFATDSDDASFLLINGAVICQWPGGHPPSGKFDHFGSVMLKAGHHRIEYYHVQAGGGTLARAGWRVPGATEIVTIPEDAFVKEVRTRSVAMERKGAMLNAFFSAKVEQSLRFGGTGPVFTTVAFEDRSRSLMGKPAAWQWDLGDGAIATERNPRHTYRGGDRFLVRMRCMDDLGFESAWQARLSLEPASEIRVDPAMEIETSELFALPGEPIRLEMKCQSGASSPLALTLLTELRGPDDSLLFSRREPLELPAGGWHTREVVAGRDALPYLEEGRLTVSLEYLDMPILARSLAVYRAGDRAAGLRVESGRLVDEKGARVVLRLSGRTHGQQGLSARGKLQRGEAVHVVVLDASLAGGGAENFVTLLAGRLAARYPRAKVRFSTVETPRAAGRTEETARELLDLPQRIADLSPDLAIVPGSLRDVLRFLPVDRFERKYHALVDRIEGVAGCDVLLVAPPPTLANPQLAQAYAIAVKRVGLLRGKPVADLYSAFLRAAGGKAEAWRAFYRDSRSEAPMYHVAPTQEGQRLMAETILAEIESAGAPSE